MLLCLSCCVGTVRRFFDMRGKYARIPRNSSLAHYAAAIGRLRHPVMPEP